MTQEDPLRLVMPGITTESFQLGPNVDLKTSLKIVMASLVWGPNADKIAKILKMNRDNVVRPRARRLRKEKVWTSQGVDCSVGLVWTQAGIATATPDSRGVAVTELVLCALIAEGLASRDRHILDTSLPDTTSQTPPSPE